MAQREPFPGERPAGWQQGGGVQGGSGQDGGAKKRGCGFWALIGLGGVVVLAVLAPAGQDGGAGGGASGSGASASASASAAPPLAVSARDLRAAFAANEVAAQARYGGQVLAVSGTIASINLDFADNPVLVLDSGDRFNQVQAGFDKADAAAIAALAKGQRVTVTCAKLSEVVGSPVLRDCVLGAGGK